MLPGRRTFTDDDIVALHKDVFAVFTRITEEVEVPDDLRAPLLSSVINMVGNRTLADTIPEGILGRALH